MAYGENHAKQIVLKEAEELSKQLKNGNADNSQVQGKAIALLVDMISPIYMADLVTVEDCRKKHATLSKNNKNNNVTEFGIGPVHWKGKIGLAAVIVLLSAGVLFAIGKTEGWW
jgi:hypothetical protein